jgi:hypothetical protein
MKLLLTKIFFSGRKRSQSPSPSRNASPNRALSPSSNRARDRSASPLRYISLPISKLARVTEELESLIHPTATTVHEEEEEEEDEEAIKKPDEVLTPVQQEEPSIIKIIEPEETFVLPELPTSIKKPEEIPAFVQQEEPTITKIVEPEESIILPQVLLPMTTTSEEENNLNIVRTEVSYSLYFKSSFGIA